MLLPTVSSPNEAYMAKLRAKHPKLITKELACYEAFQEAAVQQCRWGQALWCEGVANEAGPSMIPIFSDDSDVDWDKVTKESD